MNQFHLIDCHIHLRDSRKLLIQGWYDNDLAGDAKIRVYADDRELPVKCEVYTDVCVFLHPGYGADATSTGYNYWVRLPGELHTFRKLRIFCCEKGSRDLVVEYAPAAFKKLKERLEGNLDHAELTEEGFSVTGWYASSKNVRILVYDARSGRLLKTETEYVGRLDLVRRYPEASGREVTGFCVKGNGIFPSKVHVVLTDGEKKKTCDLTTRKSLAQKELEKTREAYFKVKVYWQQFGFRHTLERCMDKIKHREGINYNTWRAQSLLTEQALAEQRNHTFPKNPKFSVAAAVNEKTAVWCGKLLSSLKQQTYQNWELVIAARGNAAGIDAFAGDSHVRLVNAGNAGNSGEALLSAAKGSEGDYIALLSPGAVLSPETFYLAAEEINKNPKAEVLYTDEDTVDKSGRVYSDPIFKPDYDPDLEQSMNYIGHLFLAERNISLKAAEESAGEADLWDYDYVLRCCDKAEVICHIPRALCHMRLAKKDQDDQREERMKKSRARDIKALEAHLKRGGFDASVTDGQAPGIYRVRYHLDREPLVSVIIPNMDHTEDLEKCISSIETKETYKNLEIIVVENNSRKEETFSYYQMLEQRDSRVRVITWNDEFNYSAINNFGAAAAKGEFFLLLNNDVEFIAEDGIGEMVSYCQRSDVGAVGAKLLYEDGTIQHGGVILGLGGIAGHAFGNEDGDTPGYCSRALCIQDFSAVTAACMMVRRDVYEKVGGFSTELSVAYNDVDFCLNVRKEGYLIVYDPYVLLYHYESKSRGSDGTPEKGKRFYSEVETCSSRWESVLGAGDPYYNPNLTVYKSDFSLKTEADNKTE
mgnify:CR=1 FL=1